MVDLLFKNAQAVYVCIGNRRRLKNCGVTAERRMFAATIPNADHAGIVSAEATR